MTDLTSDDVIDAAYAGRVSFDDAWNALGDPSDSKVREARRLLVEQLAKQKEQK